MTTHRWYGVGLGLAIARRRVEEIGGEIACGRREGGGSTFSFTVPIGDHPHRAEPGTIARVSATLYFDLGSPYAYLALERLERFDLGPLELRVISLGALFKLTGRSSWALSARREIGMSEVSARASAYGLPPVCWPQGWPGNYLHANRACIVADEQGSGAEFARTALRAAFVDGVDLGDDDAVLDATRTAGLDPEYVRVRMAAPEVKERLRKQTDEAHAEGVIGVPTLSVGGRLYWGEDQLEIAAQSAR